MRLLIFQLQRMIGYSRGLILTSLVKPEAETSLSALTTVLSPSLTTSYFVGRGIFLNESGFHPSGTVCPSVARENFATSMTGATWADADDTALRPANSTPHNAMPDRHVRSFMTCPYRLIHLNIFMRKFFVPSEKWAFLQRLITFLFTSAWVGYG